LKSNSVEEIMPSDSSFASTLEKPFKTSADFEYLRRVIMREVTDGPVPILEMMVDGSIMGRITGLDYSVDRMSEIREMFTYSKFSQEEALERYFQFIDLTISFSKVVGYDSVLGFASVPLQHTKAVFSQADGKVSSRPWQNEHSGVIQNRSAFEAYPWPDTASINVDSFDYMAQFLSPGMKIHMMYMGVFEDLRSLMGFETMALASIDEPELLDDIIEKLTVLAEAAIGKAAAHPSVGVIFYADDMGFKTSTMLSPKFFREKIMPSQMRCAVACHKHGKPFILHSCGQIDALMEDLIEVVDVGLLSIGSPDEVRTRVRKILDTCGKNGGFALGSGNSVTNYAKIENYYAMIDETRKWNEEQGRSFG
jgi:uroporphyrinogen decarboxylase